MYRCANSRRFKPCSSRERNTKHDENRSSSQRYLSGNLYSRTKKFADADECKRCEVGQSKPPSNSK
ncbi:hypothetical protein E2C01_090790 [Portunus trituberculatus]|uniref:Uncharacterized protein n=1 Tax=Portunus trituberculatus TaxID=210409 RepID=A0A5B7JHJ4_PORTR|nr:hypothetical protein [Portunus trituberculatus]